MAETIHDNDNEADQSPELSNEQTREQKELAEQANDRVKEAAESSESLKEHVEQIEDKVEAAQPTKAEDVAKNLTEAEPAAATPVPALSGAQAQQAVRTYLGQVRHHLSKPDQTFSQFIHNPAINAISEATGKTLIRPSGILTGGLFALIGSAYYYYATNQTGYHYNFMFALLLFVGGFIVGIVLEMLFKLIAKGRKA